MLNFIIGCAVIVGVWYQWILPERRRRHAIEDAAIGMLLLHPDGFAEVQARNPAAFDRRRNRSLRRHGLPPLPKSEVATGQGAPAKKDPFFLGMELWWVCVVGAMSVLFWWFGAGG